MFGMGFGILGVTGQFLDPIRLQFAGVGFTFEPSVHSGEGNAKFLSKLLLGELVFEAIEAEGFDQVHA